MRNENVQRNASRVRVNVFISARLRDRGILRGVPLSPLIFIPRSVAGIIGAGKPGSPRSPLGPVRPGGP